MMNSVDEYRVSQDTSHLVFELGLVLKTSWLEIEGSWLEELKDYAQKI